MSRSPFEDRRPRPVLALLLSAAIAILAAAWLPPHAQAAFSLDAFEASASNENGTPDTLAGTHPYAMHVNFALAQSGGITEGDLRSLSLALPPGLLANPAAVDECTLAQFSTPRSSPHEASRSGESCPDSTQVGVVAVHSGTVTRSFGVFNLAAPFGSAESIGFAPFGVPIELDAHVREADAALSFDLTNLSQAFDLQGLDLTLWGTPWEHAHDGLRGNCLDEAEPATPWGLCSTGSSLAPSPQSYLTLPSACGSRLHWAVSAGSWQGGIAAADALGPAPLSGCVEPLSKAKVQLRTDLASTPTGLVFNIDINDGGGFLNPPGIVRSPVQKAVVALPEGLTINPSLGAGLGVCSEADFAREPATSAPGAGCPNVSKIGDVSIEGLLGLREAVQGSVFLAKPYENPSGSLLGLYLVASSPRRGLFTKAVGRLEPDPHSGRLVASFEGLPQLHYTHFQLSLREGQRAALISPPSCGEYATQLELRPWSDPTQVLHDSSPLLINHGEGGGACPSGAARSFSPQLIAGSLNTNAGSYTPFDLRLTRTDADQEITSYSATFPPGLLGRIAGIPYCPEAAIAAAGHATGTAELQSPSCPAASLIGHTLVGYGAGPVLAYAPGALYLAGPYHGAPLSVVALDSALVGPFDLGTVVIRSAIRLDPRTARASIDSSGSDPIPHILKGIPLHLRDIRVHVDRPGFTLNPTSCDPLATLSSLTGSGLDPFNSADDSTATSSARFQVSNCSALGFKPKLALRLKGGTKRGDYPSLHATLTPRPGDANIGSAAVTLPPAEFLAQEHIGNVCTVTQFQHGACPPSSVYGHASATTPLLGEALEGPVYLRTSTNPLPDLVAALRGAGGIAIEVIGRVDSFHRGLRGRFEVLPDAPVSKFTMTLNGGKRGLLVNEKDICAAPQFASARLVGQSNQGVTLKPRLMARCGKHRGQRHGKGAKR